VFELARCLDPENAATALDAILDDGEEPRVAGLAFSCDSLLHLAAHGALLPAGRHRLLLRPVLHTVETGALPGGPGFRLNAVDRRTLAGDTLVVGEFRVELPAGADFVEVAADRRAAGAQHCANFPQRLALDVVAGNLLLGTTTSPTSAATKVLVLGDNAGEPVLGANTAAFYAADVAGTVEAFAVDEAGNQVQLTQHDVRLRAVAFGGGDWADDLAAAGQIDVAFRPVINDFRGRQSVELHLVDWQGS